LPGWTRSGDVRFFGPGNLWEYINGAAEGYLSYNFQEVVTAEYSNPEKQSQSVIDVYRMEDPLNAFGIYTQELNPDSEFHKIGVEGYVGGTALNFWSGSHYVKITVFQESEELKQVMTQFAQLMSRKMGDPGAEPAEAAYFPRANLISHSIRYLSRDVLGQTYLNNAFEARYKEGGGEFKLLIVSLPGSDQAQEALAQYRQFIAASGSVQQDMKSPADGGFSGKDSYYGNMAAVRRGRQILISLGGPSLEFSLSKIGALLPNIK
jgi:hypothetical protein